MVASCLVTVIKILPREQNQVNIPCILCSVLKAQTGVALVCVAELHFVFKLLKLTSSKKSFGKYAIWWSGLKPVSPKIVFPTGSHMAITASVVHLG